MRSFISLVFIAVLVALLAVQSKALDSAIALLGLALVVVGSVAALWKIRNARGDPNVNTFPSQIGWLPKKWRKWLLGESDHDRS